MSITVNLGGLSSFADGQTTVKVEGNTTGQCLEELLKQLPDLKPRLFNKKGKLRKYIDIYVNRESAYPQELEKAVSDGDELHIMLLVVGG
jgi:molybdopterin converting factor small subunit